MKTLYTLLIPLVGILASLLLLEIIFRLLPTRTAAPWSDRPKFYYQHSEAPTLQDYPYAKVKDPSVFRIAVVGDSFSFAPYMQFDDAFPKKLERMLNLNSDKKRSEVINYSVPAYSTNHEVPKVRQAIDEQADLIILQITLNDPEIKGETPIGITVFDKFGPPKYSGFVQTLIDWSSLAKFVAQRLHNNQTQRDYRDYFLDLFENPRSWNSFRKALQQISEAANNSQKKLVAVVFPLFGLPLDENYPFYAIHEKVAGALNELQIPFRDISDIYKGIPLERLQVMPGVDRHPNEIAHRMAAEEIYTWLVSQKLLPDDLKIQKRFKGRTRIIKEDPILD